MTTSNDKSPRDENDKAFSSLKQNVHKPVRRGSIEKNSRKTFFSPLRKSSSFSLIHNVSKPVRRGSDGGGGGEGETPQQYLLPPLNLLDDHSSSSSSSTSSTTMSTADLITIALNDVSMSEADYDHDCGGGKNEFCGGAVAGTSNNNNINHNINHNNRETTRIALSVQSA
jgi:hypothetical protein